MRTESYCATALEEGAGLWIVPKDSEQGNKLSFPSMLAH
jgi:ribosomal protein L24E